MAGYYYDRREDETPDVVADAVFVALVQLFIPFPYNEPVKPLKKSLYYFIDRELFAYSDVIKLTFYKMNRDDPVEIDPSEAVIFRFSVAYFLHCMINRKLSSCKSEFHELAGSFPDIYLLDELFKTANICCNYHPAQEWLAGTVYITQEGKYLRNSFLNVSEDTKTKVFDAARSCRFTLHDFSGNYEYSWSGVGYRKDSICIEINIKHPLEEYAKYGDMVQGLLKNWTSRIFDSFRDEILMDYKKGMIEKDKEKLAINCGSLEISDISFEVSESFYWKLLGLRRKNTNLSQRFSTDLELMLYTLSVGENLHTFEKLRRLRNNQYGQDVDSEKSDEMEALKKTLLTYLHLGPERYLLALEWLKDLFKAGIPSDSFWVKHDKVRIPNMPRMVLIGIALDRYTCGLKDIRRLEDGRKDQLIGIFRKAFIETEVEKLRLITKEELELLLEKDYTLGAKREDLEKLRDAMQCLLP